MTSLAFTRLLFSSFILIQGNKQKITLIDFNHTLIALLIKIPLDSEISHIQSTSTTAQNV
jgi:hypothetical protein